MLLFIATERYKHEIMLAKGEKDQLLQKLSDSMATIDNKTDQILAVNTLLEETEAALKQEREKHQLTVVGKER